MDVNQKLNGKQLVIVLIILFGFGYGFKPISEFVLTHPLVGILLLVAIIISWWFIRKSRKKPTQACPESHSQNQK